MKHSLPRWCLLFGLLLATMAEARAEFGQPTVDSLLALSAQSRPDTLQYRTLEELALALLDHHADSARLYARRAVALTERIGELPRRIEAYRVLGKIHFQQSQLDSAEHFARRSIALGQACKDSICQAQLLLSVKFLREPLWQRSAFDEIIAAFTAFRDLPGLNEALHFEMRRLLSYPLMEIGEYDRALEELQLVQEYSTAKGKDQMLCDLYGELINVYINLLQYEKATATAKERVSICRQVAAGSAGHATMQLAFTFEAGEQLDSAYFYYQKALQSGQLGYFNAAYALGGLTLLAQKLGYASAHDYAAALSEYLQNDRGSKRLLMRTRQYIQGTLARYHLEEEQFARAHQLALSRLEEVRQNQTDTTDLMADALRLLSEAQAGLNDYEAAWTTYREYHAYQMAVVNRTQQQTLAHTAVEMELAENLLAKEKAERATLLEQRAAAARSRLFVASLSLAALLVIVLLWAVRRASRDRRLLQAQHLLVEQSLAEKEVLLREIHHRVKNNLQIISSLLNKQARKSTDAAVKQVIQEGQDRIQSMALIHQNLYESDHLSAIDIKNYLYELSRNIQRSQAIGENQVELELDVAQEKLDIDTAIPIGLILNELLTNCYKYAFPNQRTGKIKVNFRREADKYHLAVADNGIGFSPETNGTKQGSLGISLVKGLVRQLNGTIHWRQVERGTAVNIAF